MDKKEIKSKIRKKIVHTFMLKKYLLEFILRIIIFLCVLALYIFDKDLMARLTHQSIFLGITPIHVLWLFFMIVMLTHIFPHKKSSMTMKKARYDSGVKEGYDRLKLLEFVQKMNLRAWMVMLVWLCFNAVFGILYLCGVLDDIDLTMLTVFYFLSDYICIMVWCPFQTFFMKNKCCINCRIYDWGHFMMFTPMLFIKNFFSWSLFFTSLIVLIRWEIYYAKHPERFWFNSNENLQCVNCKEKICQIKNRLL